MDSPTEQKGNRPRAGQRTLRIWLLSFSALAIIIVVAFVVRSASSSGTKNSSSRHNDIAPAVAVAVTQVSMRNLQFDPATIEIKSGDTVEWKNEDLVVHTATSASFDSGTIASGQSWRHTFTNAGNFPYACTFHPQMKGTLTVK